MESDFTSKTIIDVVNKTTTITSCLEKEKDYTSVIEIEPTWKEKHFMMKGNNSHQISNLIDEQSLVKNPLITQRCSAQGCTRNNGDCELFRFPLVFKYVQKQKILNLSELWRCREWVKGSGNSALIEVDPCYLHQKHYICSQHFDSFQFTSDGNRKLLNKNAIPQYWSAEVLNEEFMNFYDLKWNIKASEDKLEEDKVTRKCCVSKCNYKPGDTLFAFPKVETSLKSQQVKQDNNFNRCRKWVQACGNAQLLQIHPTLMHKRKKICVRHFDANQLYQSQKRLKGDAIPSKYLPKPIADRELEMYTQNFIDGIPSSSNNNDHVINMQQEMKEKSLGTDNLPRVDADCGKRKNSSAIENPEIILQTESAEGENLANFLQESTNNCQIIDESEFIQTKTCARRIKRKCCAPNCKNDGQTNLIFFHLPNVVQYKNGLRCIHEDKYRRFMEWVEVIGNPKLIEGDPQSMHRLYMICSDHFHVSCFTNKFKKRLRKDAMPTYLNSTSLSKELMDGYKSKMDYWKGLTTMNSSMNTSMPFSSDALIAKKFEDEMKNLKIHTCEECKEISLTVDTHPKCTHQKSCWKFSDGNNMDPGPVPDELKELSFVEEALIAKIHPMISVFKLKGHQYGYRGNIINFCQDVSKFAKKLPHNLNDLTSVINVRYEDKQSNVHDFFVRTGKVRAALIWLKNNNPFYKDIEISEENLAILPDHGNVVDNLHSIIVNEEVPEEKKHEGDSSTDNDSTDDEENEDEDENDLEEGDEKIHKSFVPNMHVPDQESLIRNKLKWPKLSEDPVDEYNSPGYIACAFPTLFPYGKADLRDYREHEIKPGMYFKHLMLYHDERFARHKTFRFFAYNSVQRWTAISDGNVFVKNNPCFKNMTKDKLKALVEENPNLLKKIMHQGSNLRGTKAFWHARSSELQDMVTQLGLPTIFLTLSCADGHWLDLYRILSKSEDVHHLSEKQRRQLIQDNPHIVDMFFNQRVEAFIKHVLQKKYEVEDYWYRVEYQHRGSPHIHGVFWIKDAPDVSNLENETEEKLNEVLKYFSKLITAINPDRHCSESDDHPCRRRYEHVIDFQEDLAQILNKVQRHTRCSKNYCLRFSKVNKKIECRFKFPMDLKENGLLKRSNISNEYEFEAERNDPLLNKYNQFIIQLWRANIDIAPVISKKALLAYLTKYISKCEVQSRALDEMLSNIIKNMADDSLAINAIRRLFVKSCAERDISAQEVCHTLLGLKLYSSGGRKFVIVNFNANEWLKVDEDQEKFGTNFIEKYEKRPPKYEHVSLWDAAKNYTLPNWNKVKKQNIVRVFPKMKLSIDKVNREAYFRQKVLLHIPWRDRDQILNLEQTWEEVYHSHNIIESGEHERLALNQIIPEEQEYDIDLCDSAEEENEDFMVVSKLGPNQTIEKVPLGNRDVDLNYDWSESVKMYEKYGTLNEFQSFVETQKKKETTTQNESNPEMPMVQFSKDQQEVINLIKLQVEKLKQNEPIGNIPKRVVVQGKAGTGKSLIIKYITAKVHSELGKESYVIGAPTGVSALLINGKTLHSIFKLPKISSKFKTLKGESAQKLCLHFKNVKFLILDEYSLIGCSTLAMIDLRCKQATGNYDEDFGGLHIFFFGDIKQLPPVKDSPVYTTTQKTPLARHGKIIFDNIQKAYILQTCHRQQDRKFLEILDHISDGTVTFEDCDILRSRFPQNLSDEEVKEFAGAIRLFTTKLEVKEYNIKRLSEERDVSGTAVPIARIPAKHNNQNAKHGTADDADGLASEIFLSKGCKIMLRKNLWVSHGLVNGAFGKVVDILYEQNQDPKLHPPRIILCEFEDYTGPGLVPGTKIIPIAPVLSTWETKEGENCSRCQFPIELAYACSVHKSQGMTLKKAVINIATEFAIGLAYVALSRVKNLKSIIIDPFPQARLLNIGKSQKSATTLKLRNELIENLSKKE